MQLFGRRVARTVHLAKGENGYYLGVVEQETGNYSSFAINDDQVWSLCDQAWKLVVAARK